MGTGGGRREVTAGADATTVPPRPRVTTTPRTRSSLYAAATVPAPTPSSSASRRTGGSEAPGCSAPSATPLSTDAAISLAVPPTIPYCSATDNSLYRYKNGVKGDPDGTEAETRTVHRPPQGPGRSRRAAHAGGRDHRQGGHRPLERSGHALLHLRRPPVDRPDRRAHGAVRHPRRGRATARGTARRPLPRDPRTGRRPTGPRRGAPGPADDERLRAAGPVLGPGSPTGPRVECPDQAVRRTGQPAPTASATRRSSAPP